MTAENVVGHDGLVDYLQGICAEEGTKLSVVRGSGRQKRLVNVRYRCAANLRMKGLSLPEIGQLLHRHHTTVMDLLRRGYVA